MIWQNQQIDKYGLFKRNVVVGENINNKRAAGCCCLSSTKGLATQQGNGFHAPNHLRSAVGRVDDVGCLVFKALRFLCGGEQHQRMK